MDHKQEAIEALFKNAPGSDREYESAKFDVFKDLAQISADGRSISTQSRSDWDGTMKALHDVGISRSLLSAEGKYVDLDPK